MSMPDTPAPDDEGPPVVKRMVRLPGRQPIAQWLDPFASVWATAAEHADRIGVPGKTMRRRLLDIGPHDPNCWRGGDIRCVMIRDPEGIVRSIEGHAAHYGVRPDTLKHRGAKYGWRDPRTWSRERVSAGPPLLTKRPRYDKPRPKKPPRPKQTQAERRERKRKYQAKRRALLKAQGKPTHTRPPRPKTPVAKPEPPREPAPTSPTPTPDTPPRKQAKIDDGWRNPFPTAIKPAAAPQRKRTPEEDLRAWADDCGFGRFLK